MSKNPLFRAMDVMVWVTVFYLARQLPHPYPFAWEGFVGGYVPKQLAYYLISMLWVAGLWFALYRARDRAEAVDHRAVLAGMALMFLVIMTPYATGLLFSSKSRFVYRFFGGTAVLTALAACGLLWALEPTRGAFGSDRRKLLVALGIVAAGLGISLIRHRQLAVLAVGLAGLWLFVAPFVGPKADER